MTDFELCPDNIFDRLKVLRKVPHKGDGQRATLTRITVKKTKINWTQKDTNNMFTLVSPISERMTNFMESASSKIMH